MLTGLKEVWVASSWQSVLSGTFFFPEEADFKCYCKYITKRSGGSWPGDWKVLSFHSGTCVEVPPDWFPLPNMFCSADGKDHFSTVSRWPFVLWLCDPPEAVSCPEPGQISWSPFPQSNLDELGLLRIVSSVFSLPTPLFILLPHFL